MRHRASANSPGRGVWMAQWQGPNGETILAAVDRNNRRIGDEIMVPIGGNHLGISDELWNRVDAHDPIPNLKLV